MEEEVQKKRKSEDEHKKILMALDQKLKEGKTNTKAIKSIQELSKKNKDTADELVRVKEQLKTKLNCSTIVTKIKKCWPKAFSGISGCYD